MERRNKNPNNVLPLVHETRGTPRYHSDVCIVQTGPGRYRVDQLDLRSTIWRKAKSFGLGAGGCVASVIRHFFPAFALVGRFVAGRYLPTFVSNLCGHLSWLPQLLFTGTWVTRAWLAFGTYHMANFAYQQAWPYYTAQRHRFMNWYNDADPTDRSRYRSVVINLPSWFNTQYLVALVASRTTDHVAWAGQVYSKENEYLRSLNLAGIEE